MIINNLDSEASIYKNKTNESKTTNKSIRIDFEGSESNLSSFGAKIEAWVGGKLLLFENYPVRGYLSSVQKGVLVGLGQNNTIDSLTVTWPDGKSQVLKTVNKNLKLRYKDASFRDSKSEKIEPLFQLVENQFDFLHTESDFNDFNQTASLHKMLSKFGPAIAKADINADGLEDFVVGGAYRGNETMVFVQNSKGKFSKTQEKIGLYMQIKRAVVT